MAERWYQQHLRCKPTKAVVKLHNDDGTFLEAVNIPSVLWPLNAPYEVFHCDNCKLIEDPAIAEIVDTVPYQIGHCYSNAENVAKALQGAGYNAVQYCGWMFIDDQYPIHHSWAVLDGIHVIDLADEFSVLAYNAEQFGDADLEEARKLMVDFHKWIRQFPNSKRIIPFGVPAGKLLYIGCPCSRMEGIEIYNKLTNTYPHHPCNERLVAGKNCTKMQLMLQEAGLMD